MSETNEVICPGCGERVSLEGLKVGDRIDCANCANLTVEVVMKNGQRALRQVHQVSCPVCDRLREVPEGFGPGDSIECCGKQFILTYGYGAYALEKKTG